MSDELTFASSGVAGVHYAKCWPCMLGHCPGGWHAWADADDVTIAARLGRPDPSEMRCACVCVEREPESLLPDIDDDLAGLGPCHECGETGACGYDTEGRPMIHADWLANDGEETP